MTNFYSVRARVFLGATSLTSSYHRCSGSGLSLIPKLKYEHVYLTSFSKMRVDLAAQVRPIYVLKDLALLRIYCLFMQVLSTSVAEAVHLTSGEEARETACFIEMFDKFFDCLNVNNFNSGKNKRKVFQDPFRPNDFRLKVRSNY